MAKAKMIAALIAASSLAWPAAASASYFISKKEAEHDTRDNFHYRVGYHYTVASCRPQDRKAPEPGYIYHRWVCGFLVGDSRYNPSCRGQARIRGSSETGTYYILVLWHEGKCPRGFSD